MSWTEAQDFEAGWWGDCSNTFSEEAKQITYAHRMGLLNTPDLGHWPSYDVEGKSILDIGGGPVSILLKCRNLAKGTVVDPCPYPSWVKTRYAAKGITYIQTPAEDFDTDDVYDEAWMYNVLQHVRDTEKVVNALKSHAKVVRVFEWADTYEDVGHPQVLKPEMFFKWFGQGQLEWLSGENDCHGKAFYGVFEQ